MGAVHSATGLYIKVYSLRQTDCERSAYTATPQYIVHLQRHRSPQVNGKNKARLLNRHTCLEEAPSRLFSLHLLRRLCDDGGQGQATPGRPDLRSTAPHKICRVHELNKAAVRGLGKAFPGHHLNFFQAT